MPVSIVDIFDNEEYKKELESSNGLKIVYIFMSDKDCHYKFVEDLPKLFNHHNKRVTVIRLCDVEFSSYFPESGFFFYEDRKYLTDTSGKSVSESANLVRLFCSDS